ncbi:uncharacterized protein RJT21DRAFT_107223 [Scheffersomyces amazonensis]|uniref:uncharacterized protein n=1 Tax=Scheffersomyces amazonensis TaxID=1078765 RepID=UPI00315D003C
MHQHRSFSFDRFKAKVRRASDGSAPAQVSPPLHNAPQKADLRRNSMSSSPMIIISESSNEQSLHLRNSSLPATARHTHRLRAQSLSIIHATASRSRSRSTSRSSINITNSNSTSTNNNSNNNNNNNNNSGSGLTPTSSPPSHFSSSLLGSKKQTKELIKQETSQIISKKLWHVLADLGLQQPIPLKTTNSSANGSVSKSVRCYVANTNDCIYLPPASSASFTYEDVENGGAVRRDEEEEEDDSDITRTDSSASTEFGDDAQQQHVPHNLQQKLKSFSSPNYLCTKIDSDLAIPHTFAVIIELSKDTTTVSNLKFEFQSLTSILWPSGDPYNKVHTREKFTIGTMEWSTTLHNCDYYINTSNSNDTKVGNITPDELARRTREYRLTSIGNSTSTSTSTSTSNSKVEVSADHHHHNHNQSGAPVSDDYTDYKAGLYVFLLPVLLPDHIPASIISVNGSLQHNLAINFSKTSDKLNRKIKVLANYNLPMVRTPPSFANSIADKPIYVNRVWNDALHYVITFPKKYISLGSEHVINVKLVPLVKDVIIKRIKFNVLERITYVSQNLSREFDYDSDDPYCTRTDTGKIRERIISLCELKTKVKQSSATTGALNDPYKEEIVKCPDNNLLFSCYEPEDSTIEVETVKKAKKKTGQNSHNHSNHNNHNNNNNQNSADTMIASPLDINISLPFLTTKMDKILKTAHDDEHSFVSSPPTSRKASLSIDHSHTGTSASNTAAPNPTASTTEAESPSHHLLHLLQSPLSSSPPDSVYLTPDASNTISDEYISSPMTHSSSLPESIPQGFTVVSKALYPDSNFRHIQIHHRLQVCFRISKPDPKDDYKMHHYEVVVDTPLILLSAKCNDQSIQLPRYHEVESETLTDTPPVFRTPNFSSGVSIQPLDTSVLYGEQSEQLPSFEEATATSGPITRSFSIGSNDPLSRVPSASGPSVSSPIYPAEPAPAYEEEDDSGIFSYDDDDVSPTRAAPVEAEVEDLGIDELVSFDDPLLKSRTSVGSSSSRLRSSLVSSFAPKTSSAQTTTTTSTPTPTPARKSSSKSSLPLPLHGSSAADEEGSISSKSTVSSQALQRTGTGQAFTDVSSTPTTVSSSSLNKSNHSNDDEVDSIVSLNQTNAAGVASVCDADADDDDKGSLFTQDTAYSQKVPLLTNSNRTTETISKPTTCPSTQFGHILTPSITDSSMLTTTPTNTDSSTTNIGLTSASNDSIALGELVRTQPQSHELYHALR